MLLSGEVHEGIFIEESKNRFICKVKIGEDIHECYVPSSSRIENYLRLTNKPVLIIKNKVSRRTSYSLFAVRYYNSYIIVNQNVVGKLLESLVLSNKLYRDQKFISVEREKTINYYKTDLLLAGKKQSILIEAKAIISTKSTAIFPTVFSERAITQLEKLRQLLIDGYEVHYYYVSLSQIVKTVLINPQQNEYLKLLIDCIEKGLKIIALSVRLVENKKILFHKKLKVIVPSISEI